VPECPTGAIHELNFPPRKVKEVPAGTEKKAGAPATPAKEPVKAEKEKEAGPEEKPKEKKEPGNE
jgi:hypothetical protein